MKYFHCPKQFRNKPYGCGRGPVNATVAFLDMALKCACGKALKPVRKVRRLTVLGSECQARGQMGYRYCDSPVVSGIYCKRHTEALGAVEVVA